MVAVVGVDYALAKLILTVTPMAHFDKGLGDREEVPLVITERAPVVSLTTPCTRLIFTTKAGVDELVNLIK